MLRKILTYLGLVLIIITTSECLSKCTQKSNHNTVDLDLKWENQAKPITLPGLNLKDTNGLRCYVPSEKATYFLNDSTGNCWQFTKQGDTLECQQIGSLPAFNMNTSFVFTAGKKGQEHMFFGNVSGNSSIDIYKLEAGVWNKVVDSENLLNIFSGATDIDVSKFVVGCSVEVEGEQKGCIMLKCRFPLPTKAQLGCLLFSAEEPSLDLISVDPKYDNNIIEKTYLTGVIAVKSGKILLGRGGGSLGTTDKYDLLSLKDNIVNGLIVDIANSINTTRTKWEFFPLFLEEKFNIIEPIFILPNSTNFHIYRMDAGYELQELTLLSDPEADILTKKNLLVPFYNELYLITTRTSEDGNVETVYYKANLIINKR